MLGCGRTRDGGGLGMGIGNEKSMITHAYLANATLKQHVIIIPVCIYKYRILQLFIDINTTQTYRPRGHPIIRYGIFVCPAQ